MRRTKGIDSVITDIFKCQIGGGSSIFMQGKKGGPYKFMQVFNGSGRRATQFRM